MSGRLRTCAWLAGAALVCAARPAAGQPAVPRLYLAVHGGAQATGGDVAVRREYEINAETATIEAAQPFRTGLLIDGGAGVRLWRRLGLGVSVSHFSSTSAAAIDARIPHPFRFDAHRTVSGTASGARRSETGVHVQVLYHLPLQGRLRMALFAGPSHVTASQQIVQDVRYAEEYPYDAATFASAELARASGSAVGFNAGADTFWTFTPRFGAGVLVRVSRAAVDLEAPGPRRIGLDAGGVHVALGARVLF